jgi:hypothetical protein
LRDEGTSYHYAIAAEYGEADVALVAMAENALKMRATPSSVQLDYRRAIPRNQRQ